MTKFSPSRRRFLGNSLLLAAASSVPIYWHRYLKPKEPIINVYRPGMDFGHLIREFTEFPEPNATWDCDILILGSGAAALTAAWKLKKEGKNNFVLLEGPEANGNNAGIDNGELHYPTSAHYLALPSIESHHIREMLSDIGVLIGDPSVEAPQYDEMVMVHALEERLLVDGKWQESLLPHEDEDSKRFFTLVKELSTARGEDGKKLFAMPIVLSSDDQEWRKLDQMTFATWLTKNNYLSASLRWYLNYCCRDDYGQGIEKVSAWAGLHYYCSRNGHALHAKDGGVLTWQDGLASFSNKLRQYIGFQESHMLHKNDGDRPQLMKGAAFQISEQKDYVEVAIGIKEGNEFKTAMVKAKKVICAMPVHIASYIIDDIEQYGYTHHEHHPIAAPWIVTSFVLNQYPQEKKGAPLAWDNVVHEGKGLGYVVSTHQLIRAAKPERTAFTAYHALDHDEPSVVRTWLQDVKAEELKEWAFCDLEQAYGKGLWQYVEQVDMTLRGHAMASPVPGYLSNEGLKALQKNNTRLLFAHADLSGYSVIEESTWWGYQAALKCLA